MRDWKATLSTLFAASIATLLIWTWAADRTRELRTLSGTVILRPSDSAKRFVDPAQPQSVTVSVKASPASLTRLQSALEQGLVLQLDTDGVETGTRSAVLGPLIERTVEVRGTDADISSVRPARIDVRVGAMVPVRMPVVARVPLVTLWGPALVQPTEVTAMVPETAAEAASKESIEAVVNAKDLPAGTSHTVDASLRLPDALKLLPSQVTFTPDRVQVSFTVAGKSQTITLPSVRIEIAGAPQDLQGFDVTFGEGGGVLRDVVLGSQGTALADVESGKTRVVAIVHLTPEDLAKRITQKAVSTWVLPAGSEVNSVAGVRPADVVVPLLIKPKPAAGEAPAGLPAEARSPSTAG